MVLQGTLDITGFLDYNNTDSHVLITTIAPLQLCQNNNIVWHNPKTSSTRNCRLLKIDYIRETSTTTS